MLNYITPIVDECVSSFKKVVGMDLSPDRKSILEKNKLPMLDFSTVVGLTGKNMRGSISISMNKKFALMIAKRMTGKITEELDEDVDDAIGELVNIISGRIKKQFEDTMPMIMSVPTIVHGEHNVLTRKAGSSIFVCIPAAPPECENLILTLSIESDGDSEKFGVNLGI